MKKREPRVIALWIYLGIKWGKVIGCGEGTMAYGGSLCVMCEIEYTFSVIVSFYLRMYIVMFNMRSLCFNVFDMRSLSDTVLNSQK